MDDYLMGMNSMIAFAMILMTPIACHCICKMIIRKITAKILARRPQRMIGY